MNKAEFVTARNPSDFKNKASAERVLNAVLDIITDELSAHREVTFMGFGTFKTAERKERAGKNPKTGEDLVIPATIVPKFKAGKHLKDVV